MYLWRARRSLDLGYFNDRSYEVGQQRSSPSVLGPLEVGVFFSRGL